MRLKSKLPTVPEAVYDIFILLLIGTYSLIGMIYLTIKEKLR